MSDEMGIPGRRFLGHRKAVVDQIISDRDIMIRHAEGRVQATEARIAELEDQLRSMSGQVVPTEEREAEFAAIRRLQQEHEELQARREALEAEVAALRDKRAARDDEMGRLRSELQALQSSHEQAQLLIAAKEEAATMLLTEELSTILSTAQQSARHLLDRAKSDSDQMLADAARRSEDVQAEVERFRVWREQVDPMLHSVQAKVADVRGRVQEISGRLHEALTSMSDAVASLDTGMSLLASAFESQPHRPSTAPNPNGQVEPRSGSPAEGEESYPVP